MRDAGFYALPDDTASIASWKNGSSALFVFAVHILVVVLIAYAAVRSEVAPPVKTLAVRLLELSPPAPPKLEPPKPQPPQPAPKKVVASPVVAVAKKADASDSFVVPRQPELMPAPLTQTPAVMPAPITAARFDADYLQNPKPAYPPMSRRMNEEGKVVLKVRVSAQGLPVAVEIEQSSGFTRLDGAAKSAVERWRFVPARQGSEAIEAFVLVPLNFTLNN